jgi:diaminopimelate decarboxylase
MSRAAERPIAGILRDGLLAGVSGEDLAREFGTPLYVYDLDLIGRRIEALRSVLPAGFRLAYAVKANPALGVLAHVAATGVGADIASGGELEAVLRAGFDPRAVALTGPGKRDEELAAAVAAWTPSRQSCTHASPSCCAWPSRTTPVSSVFG